MVDPAMMWRWPVGQPLVFWLVAAMVVSAWWSYGWRGGQLGWVRRALLFLLRVTAAAALGWMLAGPMTPERSSRVSAPARLVVLADASASMKQRDSRDESQPTRWEQIARAWLSRERLAQYAGHATMQVYHFGQSVRSASDEPWTMSEGEGDSMETRLFAALEKTTGHAALHESVPEDDPSEASGTSGVSGGIVLLLSDGHDTQRSADSAVLARLGAQGWQVHAVAVGLADAQPDVSVLAWAESDFVLQGQRTAIHAAISHVGFDGVPQTVRLMHRGREIDRRTITLSSSGAQQARQSMVVFDISPSVSGPQPLSVEGYHVVADAQSGEARTENNERWQFIQVSRAQLRIALFEGQPYWDTRFLAQTLARDPQVDLTAVYGLGAGRTIITHHQKDGQASEENAEIASGEISGEQLAKFDIVILGRHCEQFFPGGKAQRLVDYVRKRGGVLIFARGRAFDIDTPQGFEAQQRIAPIEPVTWGRETVESLALQLAPQGRRSPLLEFSLPEDTDTILTRLPHMLAATRIEREKAASVVLLTQSPDASPGTQDASTSGGGELPGAAMAALVHQHVGSGQVLAMLSEGLWQWAFLPRRLHQYDMVYEQFWGRMIRWLAAGGQFLPGQSVSLSLSRLSVQPGEPVTVTAAARFVEEGLADPAVTITAPDGSMQRLELASASSQGLRWTGRFTPQQSGVHEVELLTPGLQPARHVARLAVYENAAELQDTTPRHQVLQAIASATGGRVYQPDEADAFVELLDRLQLSQATQVHWTDAFDWPWVLAVLVVAMAGEWFVRRCAGLV